MSTLWKQEIWTLAFSRNSVMTWIRRMNPSSSTPKCDASPKITLWTEFMSFRENLSFFWKRRGKMIYQISSTRRCGSHIFHTWRTFLSSCTGWISSYNTRNKMDLTSWTVCIHILLNKEDESRKCCHVWESFSILDEIREDHPLDLSLKSEIIQHLKSLESELKKTLPTVQGGRRETGEKSLQHSMLLSFFMFMINSLTSRMILLPHTYVKNNLWLCSGAPCISHIQKFVKSHLEASCHFP